MHGTEDRLGRPQGAVHFFAENLATLVFFEPLAKTGCLSFPLRQQVPGILVLLPESGEDIMDDLCFTRFLKLVENVDWLHGTPVPFPYTASWKDPEVMLADSTAMAFAVLIQVLHRRSRYWNIPDPGDGRLCVLKDFAPFFTLATCEVDRSKLTKSARWLFSRMHLNRRTHGTYFLCVRPSPCGLVCVQPGSRCNGWRSHRKKRSSRKVVSATPLFDKSWFEHHQVTRKSLQMLSTRERERTMPLLGDSRIQTWQLHETCH